MTLSSNALCTLADLKTELGITVTTFDTTLERMIESSTAAIEKYCGRPQGFHWETARVDNVKGFGTVILHVPKTPLLSIASIVFDPDDANDTVAATEYRIDNAQQGRIYRENGWLWTVAFGEAILTHPLPGTEESLFRVTYAGGFKTANQVGTNPPGLGVTGPRTLPYDLEDACITLAALRYRWAARDPAVNSERLLSWGASYNSDRGAGSIVPRDVAGVLDGYARVAWA